MTNPFSTRDHPRRIDHGGHFWDAGQFHLPLTVELTTSDSWRGLSPTAQRVALDMLFKYWRVSRGDTEVPRGGFSYTYRECNVDCGSTSFTNCLKDIVARDIFVVVLPRSPVVQRYRPGAWREFKDPTLPPFRDKALKPDRPKKRKKKKGPPCLGHFRRDGVFFTRIYSSMLESDAWRNLSPTGSAVLIDMLHTYNALTYSENKELPEGMTFTYGQCRVNCSKRSFNDARAEIIRLQWFQCPAELQRDGKVFLVPANWRSYVAPEQAKFKAKEATKLDYVEMKQARRLKKTVCKKHDVQYAKSVTYSDPPKEGRYAKSVTQGTAGEQNGYAKSVTILDIPCGTANVMRSRTGLHLFQPPLSGESCLKTMRRRNFAQNSTISASDTTSNFEIHSPLISCRYHADIITLASRTS